MGIVNLSALWLLITGVGQLKIQFRGHKSRQINVFLIARAVDLACAFAFATTKHSTNNNNNSNNGQLSCEVVELKSPQQPEFICPPPNPMFFFFCGLSTFVLRAGDITVIQ